MGLKISLVLGVLLLATASGSAFYIKYLLNQNAILAANQQQLETKISEQNDSIKSYLKKQNEVSKTLNAMEIEKNKALRESQELRNKFARHDLDNLALMKPGLIEKRVNKGTQQVMNDLVALTNPNQFDEEDSTDN
tara:strand:+ start:1228 stop:1635 length:408 start_codon:yes stop_codon:yes gene_type:complete